MVFNPDSSRNTSCNEKLRIDPLRTQFLVLLGIISLGFSCSLTPILYPSRSARWSQGRPFGGWMFFSGKSFPREMTQSGMGKSKGNLLADSSGMRNSMHFHGFSGNIIELNGGLYSKPCSISRLYWKILKVDWGWVSIVFLSTTTGMWWCTIVQNKLNCIQIWDLYTFL